MFRSILTRALPALATVAVSTSAFAQTAPPPPVRLDVVFAIDATGSMGDEIEQVKEHLRSTARSITAATPRPDVRFGIVVYRDRGDSEHTRVVPLTRNLDAIHGTLANLVADGGGDTPEDVDAGLELAIREMSWDAGAAHLLFLVGDAGPHDYGIDREQLLRDARQREIRITTIQASGIGGDGVEYFRYWANATGGVAEVLTYRTTTVVDGTPRTVFSRGGAAYVSRRELSAEEATMSISELESRRLVARDDSVASVAATTTSGVVAGRSGRGRGRGAPTSASAAPAASMAPSDSDVGGIIAREARREAVARGAAY